MHRVVFLCRATAADRGPAVGAAPGEAPTRDAPELAHPRQHVPRPSGRARNILLADTADEVDAVETLGHRDGRQRRQRRGHVDGSVTPGNAGR